MVQFIELLFSKPVLRTFENRLPKIDLSKATAASRSIASDVCV
jgi:hypothetical protein